MKTHRPSSSTDDIDSAASAWIIRGDAGLTAAEAAELDRWRRSDPRHAAALAAHEQAWSVLDRPRKAGKGEFMRREHLTRTVFRRQRRIGGAAVLFSVLLTVGLTMWRSQQETVGAARAISKTATVVVPTHQILADGSRVDLRSDAEIAVAFEPQMRRVSLQKGEAHFEVEKNPERPFIVSAAGLEVFAVGTAFSVQLGQREVAVLVTEGRVAIDRLPDGSGPVAPMLVDAGYRLVVPVDYSSGAAPVLTPLSPPEIHEKLAWRQAHLEFTDTPLGEAVALLNQYAAPHGQIRLAIVDSTVAAIPVTGFFRADSLDAFVRLIGASARIEAERVGDTITLRKAR